ncbi:MAG: divergent polysaccharide deacetylase family protein [Acidobacteria bacterium]|nr:divergent polysaccharide deacetylase family protein [Acidobacteriota bacterium]MBV9479079.1 divergent polysaccharide deacetylase family protein [Acidobacteriota bacterium]
MHGRDGDGRGSFSTIAKLTAIPLAGLAMFFLWNWMHGGITPPEAAREVRASTASLVPHHNAPPTAPPEEALPRVQAKHHETSRTRASGHGGSIVLIIDDLGFEGQPLDRLMSLDPNVNCAILPNGTRVDEFAHELHARGFEILCHLPMEPQGHAAPGRNAILTSMSDDEIARATRENIEAVPFARGVNNHMGSRATMDRRVMTSVIGAIPNGMYFIDSRTIPGSIAANVARELHVRTAARNVFLDDVATDAAVRRQVAEVAHLAEEHGVAIAIGHPHPATMRVLAEELPALRARGFHLIRASEVVR